ncbi:ABC-type siderophore export system fused ATPase/permease subunit [Ancylobacter sp. 3268]|uniref:ABC transporter transmembrane domain-containing protein n=1 Tax=Ancylobacter sp. 3268 TaxID=2817752 RepID=UPI00286159DF|nr:ABC transporter transmembrane domain-containing protein [Ancylobacter sp. 3268]MDR6955332.1 ABC-type siderophore export system fused ATPase/permease subunit [Ancylobacter sp. 3268]
MTSLLMLMRPFVGPLAIAGLFGVLASVTTVALLATTNAMLTGADLKTGTLPVFALLCLLAFGGTALADVVTNSVGQRLVAGLRRSLSEKIGAAPIDTLERYRTHRLMPVLTGDGDAVSDLAFLFAPLAIAGAVIAGCVAYLVWLSPLFALVVCSLLVIGSVAVYAARTHGISGFRLARESEDSLHKFAGR